MKTYSARPAEVEKKWVLIDADGLVVGRLATIIANRLRGKHKATFTPHVDMRRQHHRDQCREGGVHRQQAPGQDLLLAHGLSRAASRSARRTRSSTADSPSGCSRRRCGACCPRGPLKRQQMTNLRIYKGADHPHEAQKPETLDIRALNRKNSLRG